MNALVDAVTILSSRQRIVLSENHLVSKMCCQWTGLSAEGPGGLLNVILCC